MYVVFISFCCMYVVFINFYRVYVYVFVYSRRPICFVSVSFCTEYFSIVLRICTRYSVCAPVYCSTHTLVMHGCYAMRII